MANLDPLLLIVSLLSRRCSLENRHAVQAEAQTGVKRLLACARRQLSVLDEAPRRSAGVVRPIAATVVSLARQVNEAPGRAGEEGVGPCVRV